MARLIVRRLLLGLLVAVTVSIIVFAVLRLSGDIAAAVAGAGAGAGEIAKLRHRLGLDQPLAVQYADWIGGVLRGDLGRSVLVQRSVATMIFRALPVTLLLGSFALVLAVATAIPLGVIAASRVGTAIDRIVLSVSVLGQAMPSFWLGLLLILLFGVDLRWLPISGSARWSGFVLPSVTLAWYAIPGLLRLTRSGMIEALAAPHVRTAYAKGLASRRVLYRHALRGALIPVVALASVQLGALLGGSVVVEAVFAMNGVGYLAWEAIRQADYPVVQGVVLVLALIYVVVTALTDIINAMLDPRLRQ